MVAHRNQKIKDSFHFNLAANIILDQGLIYANWFRHLGFGICGAWVEMTLRGTCSWQLARQKNCIWDFIADKKLGLDELHGSPSIACWVHNSSSSQPSKPDPRTKKENVMSGWYLATFFDIFNQETIRTNSWNPCHLFLRPLPHVFLVALVLAVERISPSNSTHRIDINLKCPANLHSHQSLGQPR